MSPDPIEPSLDPSDLKSTPNGVLASAGADALKCASLEKIIAERRAPPGSALQPARAAAVLTARQAHGATYAAIP